MVNHFEAGRDELYLGTHKLLTNFYHGTSASLTDLFTFIDRVEHFAAGNVFYQFFPLAGIFPFYADVFSTSTRSGSWASGSAQDSISLKRDICPSISRADVFSDFVP